MCVFFFTPTIFRRLSREDVRISTTTHGRSTTTTSYDATTTTCCLRSTTTYDDATNATNGSTHGYRSRKSKQLPNHLENPIPSWIPLYRMQQRLLTISDEIRNWYRHLGCRHRVMLLRLCSMLFNSILHGQLQGWYPSLPHLPKSRWKERIYLRLNDLMFPFSSFFVTFHKHTSIHYLTTLWRYFLFLYEN